MLLILELIALLQISRAPVGMVLQSEGTVTIQHENVRKPARIAELLYAGDRIETAANAKAIVEYCRSNQRLAINPGSIVVFDASAFRVVKGGSPSSTPLNCALPQVALGSEDLEHLGALRGRGDPPIALYTGGTLTAIQPLFKWEPVTNAKVYKIIITDENDRAVWSAEHAAPLSEWLVDRSVFLKPGIGYRWELIAEADGRVVARQGTSFEVKPNSQLPGAASDPAARLQRAVALENAGYFTESADIFREIRAALPADERITHHLAWLYWNAKLTEATKRELARLRR